MIIVSQDKKHTFQSLDLDIESLSYFDDNKFNYGGYGIKELKYQRIMGIYKTEERAKEVLQEITEVFTAEEMFHINKSSLNNLDELTEPKYILRPVSRQKVYYMPKE